MRVSNQQLFYSVGIVAIGNDGIRVVGATSRSAIRIVTVVRESDEDGVLRSHMVVYAAEGVVHIADAFVVELVVVGVGALLRNSRGRDVR